MTTLRLLVALSIAFGDSCLIPKGASGGGSSSASSGAGGAGGESSAHAAPTGIGCGRDAVTGVVLCASISSCPSVVVDTQVFPNCGFSVHGDALDLECLCSEQLCPMGLATTCEQAASVLAHDENESVVCASIADGKCKSVAPAGKTGGGSMCDATCAGECGGDPTCLMMCGC